MENVLYAKHTSVCLRMIPHSTLLQLDVRFMADIRLISMYSMSSSRDVRRIRDFNFSPQRAWIGIWKD
ncbi:hypothetical protein OUZ56_018462 [Daphnia magna]|uniref:Uncharacterized protein n=1 Tax=Daphnia magna TaxID=35525 RepID=A0ABQ9Z8X2_9CRUS|nr:hypothetical protein OUZ56_018462 [Daphnia magna]